MKYSKIRIMDEPSRLEWWKRKLETDKDVSMKLTWSGTYKRLSCVNERERNIQQYQKNLSKPR